MRKSSLLLLMISALALALFFGCKANAPEQVEETEAVITPSKQEVVVFDENLNITYGNSAGDIPIAESEDYFYFFTSPKVSLTPKDDEQDDFSVKLFTDKPTLKKFFAYGNSLVALNEEDGLVSCDLDGSNIKSHEYNENLIQNIYIDKDVAFFITEGESENETNLYSCDLRKSYDEEEGRRAELVNTLPVAPAEIIDFASIDGSIYYTYCDEYQMFNLVKANEVSILPLQSLPPDFSEPNIAFTDGGYIYLYSQSNKIIRYDTVNNVASEIASQGQPLNAKDGFLYVVNQITARDIEIVRLNVKTNEAIVIYKNSENKANDSEEYLDDENVRVLIKSLAIAQNGDIIFVEEYTDIKGDVDMDTYLLDKDFNIKEI